MDNLQVFSKNREQINSIRIVELYLDLMQLKSSKSTIRPKWKHIDLPRGNLIDAGDVFVEILYGIIHIKSTVREISRLHLLPFTPDVYRQHIFKYSKEAEAAALGNNNNAKGELINLAEQVHGKACFETESVATQHLLITLEPVNDSFHNGCGRGNNDDPESGTLITQRKDCFNAHLRSILLVIFSVFTITLLVMIRCSAYRVPSFFRHSPSLLKGFTSSLLMAVIFSLLSLETMSKGSKFTRYFTYIAMLSSTVAVGLFIALAFLQAI